MEKIEKNNCIPCDLCGSTEHKFLFYGKDRLHGKNGVFSYVMCDTCGLVYMNPQISPEDLVGFYPNNYAPHHFKPSKSNRLEKKRRKKSPLPKSALRNLNKNSILLDVGCGNGKFLNEIKNLINCQVYGVDISKTAVKTAKDNFGLDIFHGSITETSFANNSFDLITAWQYLEHVHSPSEVLQKFYHLLKPDGICIISTPNFDSFNAKVFKDRWYGLSCPRHLYIYTPKTINKFLEKAGFLVTGISHDRSSKNLLGSLQYYFYGDNYTPEYHNRVKKNRTVKAVLSPLTRIFALLKKSDNIIVSAKKETRNEFTDN